MKYYSTYIHLFFSMSYFIDEIHQTAVLESESLKLNVIYKGNTAYYHLLLNILY